MVKKVGTPKVAPLPKGPEKKIPNNAKPGSGKKGPGPGVKKGC